MMNIHLGYWIVDFWCTAISHISKTKFTCTSSNGNCSDDLNKKAQLIYIWQTRTPRLVSV